MKRRMEVFVLGTLMAVSLALGACGGSAGVSSGDASSDAASASADASGDIIAAPGAAPDGGLGNATSTVYRCKEGVWSFQLVVTEDGDDVTAEAYLTGWDTDTSVETLIVPAVLGGAPVTRIESTAFTRANNLKALYLPQTVSHICEFAFYDLNGLQYISCSNPEVEIEDGALSSCNNAVIETEGVAVGEPVSDTEAYIVGAGTYLCEKDGDISVSDIEAMNEISQTGEYEVSEVSGPQIYDGGFTDTYGNNVELDEGDFHYTLRDLTDDAERETFLDELSSGAFSAVAKGLDQYAEPGYYLNGNKVALSDDIKAYDAATGEELPEVISTGGAYSYVAYRDFDNDGKIDALYYTDGAITGVLDQTDAVVSSENEILDGRDSAKSLEDKYLAFSNAVIEASGEDEVIEYGTVDVDDTADPTYTADGATTDTDAVAASVNKERDILWANDYGVINIGVLNAKSTSYASWAKESLEAGDSSYNYELNMQYGIGAGLYATNGGQIEVGEASGDASCIRTCGDTGNGIISIGGGSKVGESDAPFASSYVSVVNASIEALGWNSHIADCIYGGYVSLEDVTGTTGIYGSYLGQSSALANDFGAGVIEVVDCDFTTYGNGSAGAYVIGEDSGYIKAENTSFTSQLDSGLCTAGGTFEIHGGTAKGIIALRARASGAASTLEGTTLIKADVADNYSDYVTGEAAYEAAAAWKESTGDNGMPGPEMSNLLVGREGMTIGEIADAYELSDGERTTLYQRLDEIAEKYGYDSGYCDDATWRGSLFDSDIYGHPVAGSGKLITAGADYSDVPYMNDGVGAEGLQTSAIIELQAANMEFTLTDCDVEYEGDSRDYDYLIASESGSNGVITFKDCEDLNGIIWNQGTGAAASSNGGVNQDSGSAGGPEDDAALDSEQTSINVTFDNSVFTGNFADGYYGLWNGTVSYADDNGNETSMNGNYYGKNANWGITADVKNGSVINIDGNCLIGSLTIDDSSQLTCESSMKIYTDVADINDLGESVDNLEAGTYENVVIITDEKVWADSIEAVALANVDASSTSLDASADASADATGDITGENDGYTPMSVIIGLAIAAVISVLAVIFLVTRKGEE